jgi:DeoR family deoxyribose operon repressor
VADRSQRRIESIFEAVQQGGHQSVQRLAETLGVSEMTIRRDVAGTAGRLAVLGGRVVMGRDLGGGYALDSEVNTHALAKLSASHHAAALINVEDTLFIDCGSTMAHLAGLLTPDLQVTVVTYALNIASIVSRIPGVRLVMIGGVFNDASASFSGDAGLGVLENVRINKAFVSAGGIHRTLGVSCSNFYEVPAKLAAIRNAALSYVLADKSKYGQVKPAHFAELGTFQGFINEDGVFAAGDVAALC